MSICYLKCIESLVHFGFNFYLLIKKKLKKKKKDLRDHTNWDFFHIYGIVAVSDT